MNRCEGCAFNANTNASRSATTRLKARLCVEAREPFHCHEEVHALMRQGLPQSEALALAEPPLCAGYVEAVAAREANGFYEEQEEWHRAVLRGCVEYIVAVETGEVPYREGDELPPELGEFIAREIDAPVRT